MDMVKICALADCSDIPGKKYSYFLHLSPGQLQVFPLTVFHKISLLQDRHCICKDR